MPHAHVQPQETDSADTHVLWRLSACNNDRHAHCMATGGRYRPGAHRVRQRAERPTGGPERYLVAPLWRRVSVVRRLALVAGLVNATTAALAVLSGSMGMLVVSLLLAVLSFAAFLLLSDGNIE